MTTWIDHYWQADSEPAMQAALAEQANVLGPVCEAAQWFACVRATGLLPVPPGCIALDVDFVPTALGRWA